MAYSSSSSSADRAEEPPARKGKPGQQDGFLDQLSVQSSSSEEIMNSSSDDVSSNDLNTSEEFYFNK